MLAKAFHASDKPYYLMNSRPGQMNRQQAKALRDHGMVQIGGTRQGLAALDRVGRYMTVQAPIRRETGAGKPRAFGRAFDKSCAPHHQ